MADSSQKSSGEYNPNRINNATQIIKGHVPTSPDKVYRHVTGQGAIEDIHTSGVVRNAHAAGVKKGKNRWGDNVYWSRGVDGVNQPVASGRNNGFVIEAPYSIASKRQVRAEDITAVYQKRNGQVRDILNEEEDTSVVRRSRGFSGESKQNTEVHYRIGAVAALLISTFAGFLDLTELVLDVAGTFLAGVGVAVGYAKDFATLVLIPGFFLIQRAPFWKGRKAKKKMIAMVTAFIISLVPWVGAVMPETLIGVLVTIYYTRQEDKEKTQKALESNVTRAKRAVQKVRRVRN